MFNRWFLALVGSSLMAMYGIVSSPGLDLWLCFVSVLVSSSDRGEWS